jgi:circadian clock protein KaiA
MGGHYNVTQFNSHQALLDFIEQGALHIDCLILQETPDLSTLLTQLQRQEMLFPTVIVQADQASSQFISDSPNNSPEVSTLYHPAVLLLAADHLNQIGFAVDQAISKFIQLSLMPPASGGQPSSSNSTEWLSPRSLSFKSQQVRLAEKLKERLGYLGVYYKRNPQNFLRHMSQPEREELLQQLKKEYREIILTYFSDEANLNQKIDNFVNVAFFADVPVAQVVEIHMELMDAFSKQLKLEGRSDEILQDYRLTLIDTIAHLCEMYRRSIPRES